MLIDKFTGLIRSNFNWKKILVYSLPIVTFIIGLMVPSPLFDRLRKEVVADEELQLVEVTGLIMSDGSRVDVFLPLGTEICVKMGQKTVGDQTIIAKLK